MILFFALNFLAAACAFLIAGRMFDQSHYKDSLEEAGDFLAAVFVLYLAQIAVTEMLLGLAGRLFLGSLLALNLALLPAVLFLCRGRRRNPGLLAAVRPVSGVIGDKVLRLGFCVIVCFGLAKVLVNLFNPPFGWDSLNYHFTFPVEWLKHANLDNPVTINDDFAPTYYPINGSLYFLWLIFPLRSVFLADLGQLPFFVLAFFSLFGIARKLELDGKTSFLAASMFVLIPNVFKQLQIAYVDMMVAALFFYCLNFLFLLNKKFSLANVFFFALGLGWLLGVKLIALPYSILLIIPFLYLCIKNSLMSLRRSPDELDRDDRSNLKSVIASPSARNDVFFAVIIMAITVLLLGGFSYIRNFMQTGNPFYPLDIRLWGTRIFPGVIERVSYAAHFKLSDYRLGKLLFHEGLGGQTVLFVLPAAILAVPALLIKKGREVGFLKLYFLALPLLLWLCFRYFIPFANTRYLYPLFGAAMVSAFYAASVYKVPRVLLRSVYVVCVLASASELAKRQELVSSILMTIALFFLLPAAISSLRVPTIFVGTKQSRISEIASSHKPLLAMTILLSLFIFLKAAEVFYTKNEFRRYGVMRKYSGFWPDATAAWDWLNAHTSGANIAYVGRPVPFPLYGAGFKNNVYYVSVNKTEPAKIHYYSGSFYHWDDNYLRMQRDFEKPANYRSDADYAAWLDNLRGRRTDYLFVYSLHQTETLEFPVEDQWARGHPGIFELVFGNKTVRIYKIEIVN